MIFPGRPAWLARLVRCGLGLSMLVASASCVRPDGEAPSDEAAASPDAGASTESTLVSIDEARKYNLDKINAYRAQAGVPPLVLDDTLDLFAQGASEQLARDHQPHHYFDVNAYACICGLAAENQGAPQGWRTADVHVQIDQILAEMMQSPGHRINILSREHRRLGAGFVQPGKNLYFTNDFGR